MRHLQVALIGSGPMGQGLGAKLADINGAKLTGVCDVSPDIAAKAAAELQVPVEADFGAVLANNDVDGVIIATPPFTHRDLAIKAAAAGKHIFLEKPMATSVADCQTIQTAVDNAGIKLMLGHVCRYHKIHRKIRDLAHNGVLGDIAYMHIHRAGGGYAGIWEKSWRTSQEMSGGTLMEINAHEIDFMRFVCGDVKSVYAAGGNYLQKHFDFPDVAALTLHFESGAIGTLHSSSCSAVGAYGGRVDGTKAGVFFPEIWGENAGIRLRHWDNEEIEMIRLADLPEVDPVACELSDWLGAIRNDSTPAITGEDGKAAVAIAEAAYASIESGAVVNL